MTGSGAHDARYDVFVSYAHADVGSVHAIVEALRNVGLSVWLDEYEIADFQSITKGIVEGLARSTALLAYYSAIYPTRRACQWELTAGFIAATHAGDARERILVVNPETNVSHIQPVQLRDALFRRAPAPDDATALAELATSVRAHVAGLDALLGEIRALTPPQWYGMKGVGSTRFVGRLPDFWRIHSVLHQTDVPIITDRVGPAVAQIRGLGGIGKTLLAEEYALRFGAAYPGGIFWLRAHSHDDENVWLGPAGQVAEYDRQVRVFAEATGIVVEGLTHEQIHGLLARKIERRGESCLWVVDDIPSGLDAERLRHWFAPHPLARTLLTTRSRTYDALATPVDLGVLDKADAYQLLTDHRSPEGKAEVDAARSLVEELGCHALAVDVVGAALRKSAGLQTFSDFRASLANPTQDELELAADLADMLPTGHERSIASTLLRSIDRLGEEGRDFLRLASMLAVAPIPAALVQAVFRDVNELDDESARRHAALGLNQVEDLSLAERYQEREGARSVHTLVSRTVQFKNPFPERIEALRVAAVGVLGQLLPGVADPRTHSELDLEIVHARELTRAPNNPAEANLLGWIARYEFVRGAYDAAEVTGRRQLSAQRRLVGDEHPDTITSLNSLAMTLSEKGDLAGAEALLKQVLETVVRVRGEVSRGTPIYLNNLASVLYVQGDLPGARSVLEQVPELKERVLGEDHPVTLTSMNNLAQTRSAQGDLPGARALFEQVLETQRRVLGEEHPDTLPSMNNLAATLNLQGDLVGARALFEQVLETQRRVLGEEHPDTLVSMTNLATTRSEEGDLPGARALCEQVLETQRRVLGDEHPNTLMSMNNLAASLKLQGDLRGARALLEEMLEAQRRVLGKEHPTTTIAAWNLLLPLIEMRDWEAAGVVVRDNLAWLPARDPASLAAHQRQVHDYLRQLFGFAERGE